MNKNIVIFGGAFDPIHNGHINMALNAAKSLNAEVYFVPARISVWKEKSSPIKAKIDMINLAIKDAGASNLLKICLFEANSKEDKTYTIDTVNYFRNSFPNANLYLLIGTDQVNSFHLWKDAKDISKIAQLVYFPRKNQTVNNTNIAEFNIKEIKTGFEKDTSSSDIRELRSLDAPKSVINYIIDNDLYFVNKVKSYLSEKRFKHSVSVATLAYDIAICNNLEHPDWYLIAGLLHDIGKKVTPDNQKKIVNEFYKEYSNYEFPVLHQFVGHYLAIKEFGISNQFILDAIKFHTTGKANMSNLEKIVYCADKIEPLRGFDSQWMIDAIKVNLNKGFITILNDNKKYFIEHNVDFSNELTRECMEYYLVGKST